jgi:hypothetical protein
LTFISTNEVALLIEGTPEQTATATLSKLATNVPVALTGHTITATPTGKGQTTSIITFTNNTFNTIGGIVGSGTYTYAPYTPTMALVQASFAGGTEAGQTNYLLLDFGSTGAGAYVQSNLASPGNWEFETGTFLLTTTEY